MFFRAINCHLGLFGLSRNIDHRMGSARDGNVAKPIQVRIFPSVVVFFSSQKHRFEELSDEFDPFNKYFIPLWISGISGLVVHLLAVCHSSTWGYCSSLLGSIVSILAIIYNTSESFTSVLYTYNNYMEHAFAGTIKSLGS